MRVTILFPLTYCCYTWLNISLQRQQVRNGLAIFEWVIYLFKDNNSNFLVWI